MNQPPGNPYPYQPQPQPPPPRDDRTLIIVLIAVFVGAPVILGLLGAGMAFFMVQKARHTVEERQRDEVKRQEEERKRLLQDLKPPAVPSSSSAPRSSPAPCKCDPKDPLCGC